MSYRGLIVYDKDNNIIIVDDCQKDFQVIGFGCDNKAPPSVRKYWQGNIDRVCYFDLKKDNYPSKSYYPGINFAIIKYFSSSKRQASENTTELEANFTLLKSRVNRLFQVDKENKKLKLELENSEKDRKKVFEENLQYLISIEKLKQEIKSLESNINEIKNMVKRF